MKIFSAVFAMRRLGLPICVVIALSSRIQAAPSDYFRIQVVDEATGRGVPLVELRTSNDVKYFTDSNGIVALSDPELLEQKVFFHVKSHGYEYPRDAFGYRGAAFDVKAGATAQIKIKRLNIAERLYRITGAGIYRDSILAGVAAPLQQPLLNGLVMGQDTVEAVPYRGKIFWLWGDTNRASYPLGNFKTSSATSLLPGKGGLDPATGVDLTYFVDNEGFSKAMIPLESPKPIWMGGLFTLPNDKGQERLFGLYAKVESDAKTNERGLAVFNDEKAVFEVVRPFDSVLAPGGDPFRATSGEKTFLYFDPFQRTLADYAHVVDGHTYQAYTPLIRGTAFDGAKTRLERDGGGQLVYGWKTDTAKLERGEIKTLLDAGLMKPEEAPLQFRDIETDAPVVAHGSSTYWNSYRGRWVQIFTQSFGSSVLGEIWFAEADTPTGPWLYARKILTHDKYTFYNPTQHPFFAQNGGRQIYFEGTYTATYSGNEEHTPRYDYNQIMYRLALDDARLTLPVPVYHFKDGGYTLRSGMRAATDWKRVERIPFFALPPTAKPDGMVAIYARGDALQTQAPKNPQPRADPLPLFYALPAAPITGAKSSDAVVPLYQYMQGDTHWYSTDANEKGANIVRDATPLCRVWRNPSQVLTLDFEAKAPDEH